MELWFCYGHMEMNHNMINAGISSSSVYMGAVLWVVVQDKLVVYEQEEVVDSIVMRHGLMVG